ncbi:hypothetical protein M9Y10_028608 [Tritrichomonas musculus]|uniref:Uncharacterized protein n=1 Tax=Tritrichomonas musculus TaxID=1915356 RepID=A0ABR2KJU1_9EUKA
MFSPPKGSTKYTNFAPSTSSFSEEGGKGSRKINLDDIDSLSRNSYYSFYQDQCPSQSVCSKNSVTSSCSFFRVNISDAASTSQSSQKRKSNPYGFNRSEIYKYPNLVKLNLDFYFDKLKSNRSKFKNDDKFSNVFAEFELNSDFLESHFSSEEEIQRFYTKKLDQLQVLQEEEIQRFIKKWEKAQVDATVEDFQDFCFLQGTKLILRDCGNETLAQRPSLPEEKVNLRKTNEKNEKLFELMSLRHEKEAKLLVLDFQDQMRKFREKCIDSVVSSDYQISFNDNEPSQLIENTGNNIKNDNQNLNIKKRKFDEDDVPIVFEDDSDAEELIRQIRTNSDSDIDDSDINILLGDDYDQVTKRSKSKKKKKMENIDKMDDIFIDVDLTDVQRTPPLNQRQTLDLLNQRSQSEKTKKRAFRPSKRSNVYRPRFNNVV